MNPAESLSSTSVASHSSTVTILLSKIFKVQRWYIHS